MPHNLVVQGAGVDEATSDLAPGTSESLTVELKPGTYDFFCSDPGPQAARNGSEGNRHLSYPVTARRSGRVAEGGALLRR